MSFKKNSVEMKGKFTLFQYHNQTVPSITVQQLNVFGSSQRTSLLIKKLFLYPSYFTVKVNCHCVFFLSPMQMDTENKFQGKHQVPNRSEAHREFSLNRLQIMKSYSKPSQLALLKTQ